MCTSGGIAKYAHFHMSVIEKFSFCAMKQKIECQLLNLISISGQTLILLHTKYVNRQITANRSINFFDSSRIPNDFKKCMGKRMDDDRNAQTT